MSSLSVPVFLRRMKIFHCQCCFYLPYFHNWISEKLFVYEPLHVTHHRLSIEALNRTSPIRLILIYVIEQTISRKPIEKIFTRSLFTAILLKAQWKTHFYNDRFSAFNNFNKRATGRPHFFAHQQLRHIRSIAALLVEALGFDGLNICRKKQLFYKLSMLLSRHWTMRESWNFSREHIL